MEKLVSLLLHKNKGIEISINKQRAENFVDELFRFLFRLDVNRCECPNEITHQLQLMKLELTAIVQSTLIDYTLAQEKVNLFFSDISEIYKILVSDAKTLYENDPASQQVEEIFVSYPGFYATAIYRFAHKLWELEVKLVARIWSEFAHGKTGIDIHPAAKIGKNFCIDHGTGIVIGETSVIGDNVKIYQGVTLGALSVSKEKANTDRHPKIGDNVVIYSGATILGGNTHIGNDSVIGGNVWITESIEPKTIVYYKNETIIKRKETETEPIFFFI